MVEILKLRGAAALSATRLARLTGSVRSALPKLKSLTAEFRYFVELRAALADDERARLVDLLGATPVSYTPLRAHETVLDLVCRLLLAKNKSTYDLSL